MIRGNRLKAVLLAGTFGVVLGLAGMATLRAQTTTPAQSSTPPPKVEKQTATLAAGCFWSMEAIFKQLKGVDKVLPGYAGGKLVNPNYEDVETGNTGHAETINITFDPGKITFRELLDVMLTCRDPTTLNRQGNDEGTQYRSIIFYRNEQQHKDALDMIKKYTDNHVYSDRIVTEVIPFKNFYRAEDYHLDYYRLHPDQPYCRGVIAPEIARFRAIFKSKLKS
jgi:peptide-methionine (S)-S-oxide reductase